MMRTGLVAFGLALSLPACARKGPASTPPATPSPSATLAEVAEDLEVRCLDRGVPEACIALAGFVRGGVGRERDPEAADGLVATALHDATTQCLAEKRARSCVFGGLLLLAGPSGCSRDRVDLGLRMLSRGCALGSGRSCAEAGRMTANGDGVEVDGARADVLLERGCAMSYRVACGLLGHLEMEGRLGHGPDVERARRLLGDGCLAGFRLACDDLKALGERVDAHF